MAQASIGAQASRLAKDFTLAGPPVTHMPKLVYGTAWKKERTADLVYRALKSGFRGIDTAAQPKHYQEEGVGAGLRRAVTEGLVKREDIFVRILPLPSLPASQTMY
jgi:diketogulonate reductase-like aldo/keto reductase